MMTLADFSGFLNSSMAFVAGGGAIVIAAMAVWYFKFRKRN